MMTPRLDWMFGCCSSSCTGYEHGQGELQVQLSSELQNQGSRHLLTSGDSFDITFTPRAFGEPANPNSSSAAPFTPRQKEIKNELELPLLSTYPTPPNTSLEDTDEERKKKLLDMYQEFALDLHAGMYLTQLTSNRDYSDIHCQLMEDMVTLKLDQSNGRIIEFPLTNVSKVYRIVKNDDKWYTAGAPVPGTTSNTEQIVVVEFMRRKLAFVFKELQVSQRFLICMELLIRRAQQKQAKKALRSLTPAFPPQDAAQNRQCPTPRQVHEAMSRPLGVSSPGT